MAQQSQASNGGENNSNGGDDNKQSGDDNKFPSQLELIDATLTKDQLIEMVSNSTT